MWMAGTHMSQYNVEVRIGERGGAGGRGQLQVHGKEPLGLLPLRITLVCAKPKPVPGTGLRDLTV